MNITTITITKDKVIVTDHYNHPRFSVVNKWFKPINYLVYLLCKHQHTLPLKDFVFQQILPGFPKTQLIVQELQKHYDVIIVKLHTFDNHR